MLLVEKVGAAQKLLPQAWSVGAEWEGMSEAAGELAIGVQRLAQADFTWQPWTGRKSLPTRRSPNTATSRKRFSYETKVVDSTVP